MKKRKRLSAIALALMMAMSFAFASFPSVYAAENTPPGEPTVLRLDLMERPLGIESRDPAFSWVVNDEDKDEYQTAYQVVIAETESSIANGDYIFDSNWVASSESSYVKLGLKDVLKDNRLYYWQVRTKDKAGVAGPFSQPQMFTTSVGSDWASKETVWVSSNNDVWAQNGWTNYSVEFNMTITAVAMGVHVRSADQSNAFMLQFRATSAGSPANTIVPHTYIGGTFAALSAKNIPLAGKVNLDPNTTHKFKLVVIGSNVSIYIDDIYVGDVAMQSQPAAGGIGFRTGGSESGYMSGITINSVDVNGNSTGLLYTDRFASGTNDFTGGTVSAANARLTVGTGSNVRLNIYTAPRNNFMFIRDEFDVENIDNVEKAIVSITAKSTDGGSSGGTRIRQYVYNLFLNGEFVGLGPNRVLNTTVFYNTHDVTDLLKQGVNAFGAVNYTVYDKQYLLQLTVFYKDGTKEILVNSGRDKDDFKVLDGTTIFGENNSLGNGSYYVLAAENIDANIYPYGFDQPGFDDSKWADPVSKGQVVNAYTFKASPNQNVNRYIVDAAKIVDKGNNNYFIDFGKEIIGGFYLDVNSPARQQITLRYGEELSGVNTVRWQMRTGNNYQEKWTLKPGQQVIHNFNMKTFRYVEILDSPVELTLDNVKGVFLRQEFDDNKSYFDSSDELLNEIYEMCKYSIKATNQDLFVDSQSRERGAYEGDTMINMLSAYAVDDNYSLARFSEEYLNDIRTWPAEYALFSIEMAWYDYVYTGNIDSLRTNYQLLRSAKMKFDNRYSSAFGANGLFNGTYGLVSRPNSGDNTLDAIIVDWPAGERDGYDRTTVYNTVFNSVMYGAYDNLAKMAEALGYTADYEYYSDRAATVKKNMVEKLYDPVKGAFRDGLYSDGKVSTHYAQHASAYALAYKVMDNKDETKKAASFIASEGIFRCSVYGAFFMLKGLYGADGGDEALKLMTNKGLRSYYNMMYNAGSTISAEAWDTSLKSNMTFSHPWSSAPLSQIVGGLFGINPTTPGYNTFDIKIQPGYLTHASVKTPSIKGAIEASFTNPEGSTIEATVTVPVNTKAKVSLPVDVARRDVLLVDGVLVKAERTYGFLAVEIGSGVHTVSVPDETDGYEFIASKLDNGASAWLYNGTDSSVDAKAVFAVYNPMGLLVKYEVKDITVESKTGVSVDFAISDELKGCKIKVLMWDSGFKPIAPSYSDTY